MNRETSPLRATHVVNSISEEASGLSYSVPSLCRSLLTSGVDVRLHVLGNVPPSAQSFAVGHSRLPILKAFGISKELALSLRDAAQNSHILHFHSLWTFPTLVPDWAIRHSSCRLVASPRGTLSSWAMSWSRWKKQALWWTFQKRVLEHAHCLHATAEEEASEFRSLGLRNPIAVIPNGIDIPSGLRWKKPEGRRRLLFLSRIHPKKGLDSLLRVWKLLQTVYVDWELHIVGPLEGEYAQQLRQLAKDLSLERVSFDGVLYGQDKVRAYQESELFVLPTRSENFGLAVAEALANGVPVVVSQGAPWSAVERTGCGFWPQVSDFALESALRDALSLSPSQLSEMGMKGREWMQRDYSWQRVAEMTQETYLWLVGNRSRPDWVKM